MRNHLSMKERLERSERGLLLRIAGLALAVAMFFVGCELRIAEEVRAETVGEVE